MFGVCIFNLSFFAAPKSASVLFLLFLQFLFHCPAVDAKILEWGEEKTQNRFRGLLYVNCFLYDIYQAPGEKDKSFISVLTTLLAVVMVPCTQ